MPSIEDAISLAIEAHRGQKDKANAPYILHPLRVMIRMENDTDRIVAVLHDILEDPDVSVRTFRRPGILLKSYKRSHPLPSRKEEYEQFIERVKGDTLAAKINSCARSRYLC